MRDALVMVLKPGVNASAIDMNRLDDQAIAWGKTNAHGEVRLKQLVPVPGTYTVMVDRARLRAADRRERAPPRREHAAELRSVGQDRPALALS